MTYHYPDHEARARELLLDQDKKPRTEALLSVLVHRAQLMEDTLWDILQHSWLDTATGADLDRLGAIVGEARQGRDDDTYRLWVRARGRVNRSAGRVDDILEILRLVVGESATIVYTDIPDRYAEAYFVVVGTTADMTQLAAIVAAAAPAGVVTQLIASPYPPEETFAFAGGVGAGFGVGHLTSTVLG